ncbi:hypothetical protein JCM11251_006663 [Rhodosporidiobolus azoricus]
MESDQTRWFPTPQPWPEWGETPAGEWEEPDPKRLARQAEIEARVTEQHLNNSLGPSLATFGLDTAAGGGIAEVPTAGEAAEQAKLLRQATKAKEQWSYGTTSTSADPPANALPPPPQQHYPVTFHPPHLPFHQPLSAAPPCQQSIHAAPPLFSPDQQQLPDWLYQTAGGEQGGAVVSGIGQIRAASSDYGQPPVEGGAYPFANPVPSPHGVAQPSPPAAFPPFPPPTPHSQDYGLPSIPPTPVEAPQPRPSSAQALFKQYWQRQTPVPPPVIPYPTAFARPSPSLDALATASLQSSTTFPQVGDHQQYRSTPLGTPRSAYSPFSAPLAQGAGAAPSYFPPPTPGHLGVHPAESATALSLRPPNLTVDFGLHVPHHYSPVDHSLLQASLPSFAAASAVNPPPAQAPPGPAPHAASSSGAPHLTPAVDFALSNEILRSAAPKRSRTNSKQADASRPSLSGKSQAAPAATTTGPVVGKPGKKLTVDLHTLCVRCSKPIGRLILRGKAHELNVPHGAVFTCATCNAAVEASPSSLGSPPSDSSSQQAAASTSKLKAKKEKTPTYRKKNKRLDDRSSLTACDVCLRDIAIGGVLPTPVDNPPPGARIDFMIEVVCVSCDSKYRRCTDCGGGGGTRAGTGKWRCKELFLDGRKTCSLSHQRLGAFPDMNYEVWNIRDIPADEVDDLSKRCERIFRNQMLAGICIPEVLEQDGAIYTSFEVADVRARMGWKGFDPMMRNDIEHTDSIRRYLALRTCTPNRRKATRQPKEDEDIVEAGKPRKEDPIVLQDGKEIAGYIVAEWEIKLGHVFLAIVVPWDPTGETFDATTLLIGSLVRRVDEDIRKMNAERASRREPTVPGLLNVWTMLFFKKESRMLTHLIKKRDFLFIEDFLQKYPETEPKHFPPHRPCYIPLDRQPGWQILIRRQKTYSDGRFDDWNARRAVDEERGKKKEAKVRAAKEKEGRSG